MQQITDLSIKRLQIIREALGYEITAFSSKLDYPLYESVETGEREMPGILVMKLMEEFYINPLWLYGKSNKRFLDTSSNTAHKFVLVNKSNEEKGLLMVTQKA